MFVSLVSSDFYEDAINQKLPAPTLKWAAAGTKTPKTELYGCTILLDLRFVSGVSIIAGRLRRWWIYYLQNDQRTSNIII